jgi:hypothetical protein
MILRRLVILAAMLLVGVSSALGQESIRLRFEIAKNGSSVANPEVSLKAGSAGRIEIEGIGSLAFTPTLRDSNLAVAFDIKTSEKHLEPQLVIAKTEPGSISWKSESGAESFKVMVFWIR